MSIYEEYSGGKDSLLLSLLLFYACIISCASRYYRGSGIKYQFESNIKAPDYSDLNYWSASPFKYDPSDDSPKELAAAKKDSLADVFFIYPTSYTNRKMPDGWNADINDKEINSKTDNRSILYQASIFNKYCRVFAPRYRQASLRAFLTEEKAKANTAFDTAYSDVKRAFQYYFYHFNNGRPIIIASHSQGTVHAKRLLKEFFEGKPLQRQLVCAYLVGMPVFVNYFSSIKPCADSTATGCFVSWRTLQEGYMPDFVKKETQKSYVINPLNWSMDTAMAPAGLNKGAVLRNFNRVIPGLVHAQIHENVLWVNKPKFPGSILLKMKNYHIADYNLFYENVRENTGTRIRAFLKKQS